MDHAGSEAWYRSDLLRFPEQHFSVACLCNLSIDPSQITRQVADIYLAKELNPEPARTEEPAVKLAPEQLAAKVGIYHNPDGDVIRRIILQGGSLRALQGVTGAGVELRPLSDTRFRPAGQPLEIRFESGGAGGLRWIEVPDSGAKPVVYVRTAEFTPAPAELAEYAGQYLSDEIEPAPLIRGYGASH